MQKILMLLLLCLVFPYPAIAATLTVEAPPACEKCGMDRTRFSHSRMMIEYDDHSVLGLCSLHCAIEELAQLPEKPVKSLQVADYRTKVLIDAKTAIWVIGGSKKGVMTFVPKWAFLQKAEAQAFVAENGGEVTTFEAALQAAKEELTGEGSMKTHSKH